MDAIIIGGGPAGLVAANELADRGVGVTVLERRARPGGRAASDAQDGCILNQGPHAIYLGGRAERELTRLGLALAGAPPALSRPAVTRDGQVHVLPATPLGMARTRILTPGAKLAFTRWLAGVMRGPRPGL